jgi:hypothetical protein
MISFGEKKKKKRGEVYAAEDFVKDQSVVDIRRKNGSEQNSTLLFATTLMLMPI